MPAVVPSRGGGYAGHVRALRRLRRAQVVSTVVEALPQKEHAHDVRTSFPRRRPRTSPLCLFPHSRVGQAPTPGPPFCPLRGDEYLLNGECSRERSKENALWPAKIRDIRLFKGV
jgi:hypothetical protein